MKMRKKPGILALVLAIMLVFQTVGTSQISYVRAEEGVEQDASGVDEVAGGSEEITPVDDSKNQGANSGLPDDSNENQNNQDNENTGTDITGNSGSGAAGNTANGDTVADGTDTSATEPVATDAENTDRSEYTDDSTSDADKATGARKAKRKAAANANGGTEYTLNGANADYSNWASSSLLVEDKDGNMVSPSADTVITDYSKFQFSLSIDSQTAVEFTSQDTLVYELPDGLLLSATSGELRDENNSDVTMKWQINNNKMYLSFTDAYLKNETNILKADLTLSGKIDTTKNVTEESGTKTINLGIFGSYTYVERGEKIANIDILKTGISRSSNGVAEDQVVYQIKVLAGKYDSSADNNVDLENVVVTDQFTTYEKTNRGVTDKPYSANSYYEKYLSISDITAIDKNGNARTVTYNKDTETFTIDCIMQPDEEITIQYTLNIAEGFYAENPQGNQNSDIILNDGNKGNPSDRSWVIRKIDSTASVTSNPVGDSTGTVQENAKWSTTEADNYQTVTVDKTWLWTGTSQQTTTDRAYFRFKVNEGKQNDIKGWTIDNIIGEGHTLKTDITIKNLTTGQEYTIAQADANNGNFHFTFPESGEYEILFETSPAANAVSAKTEAYLTDPETGWTYGAQENPAFPSNMPSKTHPVVDYAGKTITWETYFPAGWIGAGYTYEDWMACIKTKTDDTQIKLGDSTDIYMTEEQIAGIEIVKKTDGTVIPKSSYEVNPNIKIEVETDVQVYAFSIVFKEDISDAIIIRYTTVADFSVANGMKNVEFSNRFRLMDADNGQKTYITDAVNYSTTSAITKAVEKNTAEDGLVWRISVNSNHETLGKAVVKDILPEGLNDIDTTTDIKIVEAVYKDAKTGNATNITDRFTGYDFTFDSTTRELKATFDDLNCIKVTFLVTTYPTTEKVLEMQNKTVSDDYQGESYTNTAKLYAVTSAGEEVHLVDSSAYGAIYYKALSKGIKGNLSGNVATYELNVNPSGQKLAPDSVKYLTVTDQIPTDYQNKMFLLKTSIKVYISENGYKKEAVEGTDYILNESDITGSGFTMQVLDGKMITIEYKVVVDGAVGEEKDTANNASLSWEGLDTSIAEGYAAKARIANGGSTTKANQLYLLKRDDTTKAVLEGARYEVYKYNGEGQDLTKTDFTLTATNGKGIAYSDKELTLNTVYALKEVTAPNGYLKDTAVHYVLLFDQVSNIPKNLPAGTQVLYAKGGEDDPAIVEDSAIETMDIAIDKAWVGETDKTQIVAQLWSKYPGKTEFTRDGGKCGRVDYEFITAANNWTGNFKNIPLTDADGNKIEYMIREEEQVNASGTGSQNVDAWPYQVVIDGDDLNDGEDEDKNIHITNYDLTKLYGTKHWNDDSDRDGVRPDSIALHVYTADAEGTLTEVNDVTVKFTSTDGNDWSWTIEGTGLKKYEDDGKTPITYIVKEDDIVDEDGTLLYYNNCDNTFTVDSDGKYELTNIHDPELVDVKGSKTWDDNDDQDGERPSTIKINLVTDGTVTNSLDVSADENGDWTWAFTDLYKYRDHGVEIQYAITENSVTNYSTTYDGYDVKNTHTPYKTSVTVTKAWDDQNNKDNIRPTEVTVELYANGKATGKTVKLNASNKWTASFTDLDVSKNGWAIAYTVKESAVSGYTAKITGNQKTGFVVTNTHRPKYVPHVPGTPSTPDPTPVTPSTPATSTGTTRIPSRGVPSTSGYARIRVRTPLSSGTRGTKIRISVPLTGDNSLGTVLGAIGILALGAGAIVIARKKKKED